MEKNGNGQIRIKCRDEENEKCGEEIWREIGRERTALRMVISVKNADLSEHRKADYSRGFFT